MTNATATLPHLPSSITPAAFDEILVWAAENEVEAILARSGEPLTLRTRDAGLFAVDPRPLLGTEILDLTRYVYGDYGPYLLGSGHVLNPTHEVVAAGGRGARCRIEISAPAAVFSLTAVLAPRPLDA